MWFASIIALLNYHSSPSSAKLSTERFGTNDSTPDDLSTLSTNSKLCSVLDGSFLEQRGLTLVTKMPLVLALSQSPDHQSALMTQQLQQRQETIQELSTSGMPQ